MADLTATLRSLHARGKIINWIRPGMRLVDDAAQRSYMVLMPRSGGLELVRDDLIPFGGEGPGNDWYSDEATAGFRIADDPVTVAALVLLAEEAYRTPCVYVRRVTLTRWECVAVTIIVTVGEPDRVRERVVGDGWHKISALTAALEAADV